jgi:hypothetical protein
MGAQSAPKLEVEVVKRSGDIQGFAALPWSWVIERTFRWLRQHRRQVRDYERIASSAEAWFNGHDSPSTSAIGLISMEYRIFGQGLSRKSRLTKVLSMRTTARRLDRR